MKKTLKHENDLIKDRKQVINAFESEIFPIICVNVTDDDHYVLDDESYLKGIPTLRASGIPKTPIILDLPLGSLPKRRGIKTLTAKQLL